MILFLELSEVLSLAEDQVNLYGGHLGVRDEKMLDSAVNMPRAAFGGEYLHKTIPAMAAAYAFHICQNHPFIDAGILNRKRKNTGKWNAVILQKTL